MILQALVKQYENLAADNRVSREGWCEAKVSYAIDLASDGTVRGFINLKKEEERGKKGLGSGFQKCSPDGNAIFRSSGKFSM